MSELTPSRILEALQKEGVDAICVVWDGEQRHLIIGGDLSPGRVITAISQIIDKFNLDPEGVLFAIKFSKGYREGN